MSPRYCPYYCEENIWQLCADPAVDADERAALLISNHRRKVALWGQRLAETPETAIVWDYHVVMLGRRHGGDWQVWDLDARSPQPQPALAWLDDSFRVDASLPPEYVPRFRLVAAADYLRHFRSDRRHMLHGQGAWMAAPPPWPPIIGEVVPGYEDDGSNLAHFVDCDDAGFVGTLFDLARLREHLR